MESIVMISQMIIVREQKRVFDIAENVPGIKRFNLDLGEKRKE
jgi:hypothetical protein